jgi:hypothetical protein
MRKIAKECEMAAPVMAWLSDRGMTPHGEVIIGGPPRDVGAYSEDESVGVIVEMKLCLSDKVIMQAGDAASYCDFAWIAVASKPRDWQSRLDNWVRGRRLGLLRVTGKGCEVLREAQQNEIDATMRGRLVRACKMVPPFGDAGHPTRKGIGPAQIAYENAVAYRKNHPKAKWREVWENVPNHYCSPSSMAGAMKTVEGNRSPQANLRLTYQESRVA